MIVKQCATLIVALLLMALAGCSSNVVMDEPTIPAPRVVKIPVSVLLRMPEQFESFVHEEDVLGKESWSIDLGRANATFFTQLFGHLFLDVTVIGPDDDARDFEFDALVEPSIDGFEFSVPHQSKTEAFAVWIRYRLRIFDREGNNAANWTVSAYGKSQKAGIGDSDALQRAAVLAMRDAAALIVMQMDKVTKISSLANGGTASPVAEPVKMATDTESTQSEQGGEVDYGIFAIGGIEDDSE